MSGAAIAASMQSPKLPDMIRIALESHSNTLRVAMPGVLLDYNPTTHKGKVQPLLQYKREGGKTQSLAPIAGVPVMHPRSQAGAVYLPLSAGDPVTLIVSDREFSRWKAGSGQETLPATVRAHDLADCWAYPGGYPDGIPPTPRFPGALEMYLKPGTKFAVGNGSEELLQIASDAFTSLKDLAEKLKDTLLNIQLLTVTSAGPGNPSSVPINFAIFGTIEVLVDAVIIDIDKEITDLGKLKA